MCSHLHLLCVDHIRRIIIKMISRAPIYRSRWEHRALYNNTNNTHTHMHTHMSDEGIGTAVKKEV